ncbi:hypothetical protein AS181_23550 [Gordonia sp. SGD-V-85]|nr:hypothetical protein AS181_23550 [Gordonia sp. SGD-V-85]
MECHSHRPSVNGRPPHSYDREGDLSHYRSVFEAIERRVIPEVVITRLTPYLFVLVSAAVLGMALPHTGGAHGYDVLLRTESADAESAGVLATLFTAFTLTFTVVAASIARLVRRFRWAALALAGNGVTTVFGVLAIWARQSLAPTATVAGPSIGLYLGAVAALLSTVLWARVVFTRPDEQPGPARRS